MDRESKRPTLLQIRYLEEAKTAQDAGVKCSVCRIADTVQVTHGPVSRFFKECIEAGLLTEKYRLTKKGLLWLEDYTQMKQDLREYLKSIGVMEREIDEGIRGLIENVDYSILYRIISRERFRRGYEYILHLEKNSEEISGELFQKNIDMGKYPVDFIFLSMKGAGQEHSMADYGFEHPAYLRRTKSMLWLELKICNLTAPSQKDGHPVTGHLASLKYEIKGQVYSLPVKNGKVRIPLEAFRFTCVKDQCFKGSVDVTVTCSAGERHMPESASKLIFWC